MLITYVNKYVLKGFTSIAFLLKLEYLIILTPKLIQKQMHQKKT